MKVLIFLMMFAIGNGCAENPTVSESKESPTLVTGKADGNPGFRWHGLTELDNPTQHAVTGAVFDVYEIDVTETASLTFEVTQKGTSRGIDSAIYVFGPTTATSAGGQVAFDDDDGWGRLSRIRSFSGEAGRYYVVVGLYEGTGRYTFAASCENDNCKAPKPTVETCTFGDTYFEMKRSADAITILDETTFGVLDTPDTLTSSQIVDAVNVSAASPSSYAEALSHTDGNTVVQTRLWDASNRVEFVAYEFGAGDNSFGAIFDAGTVEQVAQIQDGDIANCSVSFGFERQPCAVTSDCESGLRCNAVVNGVGACLDVFLTTSGDGDACDMTADCNTGLVCSSEIEGGLCNPAWMKRRFFSTPATTIDGDVVEATLDTFGLASVPTTVNLSVFVTHDDFEALKVTVVNPTGTEVVIFDGAPNTRELFIEWQPLFGLPGDEEANGTWTLRAENSRTGVVGEIHRFGLEVTSRWD